MGQVTQKLSENLTPSENGATCPSTNKSGWWEDTGSDDELGDNDQDDVSPAGPLVLRSSTIVIGDGVGENEPPNIYHITPTEARHQRRQLANSIFASRDKIRHILDAKEATLQDKWKSWNKARKKKFLQAVWPKIPRRKSPHVHDFLESLNDQQKQPSPATDCDTVYKWPRLNMEDLSHANNLPLLLNSRGRNNPDMFALTDIATCRIGVRSGKIKIAWLPGWTMVLIGQSAPESYGTLVRWKKYFGALRLCVAGVHLGVGTGLLILEAQSKIYDFLLECCYQMFPDTPPGSLLSIRSLHQPETSRIEATVADYFDLATAVAQAPYRTPVALDTYRLAQLLDAKRAAAEDHAWSIQEDPGYFKEVLLARARHRHDQVPGIDGRKDPVVNTQSFWNDVVHFELDTTFYYMLHWDMMSGLAKQLHVKVQPGFEKFNQQEPLPADIEVILIQMLAFAASFTEAFRHALAAAIPASKEIGVKYVRLLDAQGNLTRAIPSKPLPADDILMKLFGHMLSDNATVRKQIGLAEMVSILQCHINENPRQARRLSPFVSRLFAELAFITELSRLLDGLDPWASTLPLKAQELYGAKPFELPQDIVFGKIRKTLQKHGNDPVNSARIHLPIPIKETLNYPIDKAYNERNVNSLRRAEWNLDSFWKQWDCVFYKDIGISLTDLLGSKSKGTRVIHRTLPFCPRNVSAVSPLITNGLPTTYATHSERPGRYVVEAPRAKIKTRSESYADTDAATEAGSASDLPGADNVLTALTVKFRLKAKHLKVFRSIFHARNSNVHQGELDFKEFRCAMRAIGFGMEKLYGSVWHFTPIKLHVNKSFHVHEPHPDSKFTFVMARNIGRRLTHTYGWTGEDFGEIQTRGTEEELAEVVAA